MNTSSNTEPSETSQADTALEEALRQQPEATSGQQTTGSRTAEQKRRRKAKEKYAATDSEELRRRFYDFADLSEYPWKARLTIRATDLFFYLLIRLIGSTLRWETHGAAHLEAIYANEHRAILTFWHVCIFSATWFWRRRGIIVMSSQSKDGEFTSRFVKRFGYGTSRGSSTRGAGRALAEMTDCLDREIDVAFTIDGPKGPAYVAKPGAVTLARHSGQAILPFHIAVRRYIELPSWDRLQIPVPFTQVLTLMAEPIYVARNASPEEVAAKQSEVQAALDRLRQEGEMWRAGLR